MANLNDISTIPLREYEIALSQLAARRESHVFYNEGNEHALIVFKTIFDNAKREVFIVARDLTNAEVSNAPQYVESLRAFLERDGAKLNIMLTSFNNAGAAQKPIFKTIYESTAYKKGNVRIYNLNGKKFQEGDAVVHFCFADSQMYRIETDTELRKARGNFNDSNTANSLLENFRIGEKLSTTTEINLSEIFN